MHRLLITAAAIATAATLVGCSGTMNRYDYEDPIMPPEPQDQYEIEDYEPDPADIPPPYPEPEYSGWSCYYDETYNYDWHDDVICTNGIDSHRPYLLEWADYVTYDDIMIAAAEYEASLNSTG